MSGQCETCCNTLCICDYGEPLDVAALRAAADALAAAAAEALDEMPTGDLGDRLGAALAAYRAVRGGEG